MNLLLNFVRAGLFTLLLVTGVAQARFTNMLNTSDQPPKCPSAKDVKSFNLNFALRQDEHHYTVLSDVRQFGTKRFWVVGISGVEAPPFHGQMAIDAAKKQLGQVGSGPSSSKAVDQGDGFWGCIYPVAGEQGGTVIAITPVLYMAGARLSVTPRRAATAIKAFKA